MDPYGQTDRKIRLVLFGKVWRRKKYCAEHFCQLTDEVIVPLFKNLGNIEKFPQCLVNDIKQQVSNMSTFSGQRLRKSGA